MQTALYRLACCVPDTRLRCRCFPNCTTGFLAPRPATRALEARFKGSTQVSHNLDDRLHHPSIYTAKLAKTAEDVDQAVKRDWMTWTSPRAPSNSASVVGPQGPAVATHSNHCTHFVGPKERVLGTLSRLSVIWTTATTSNVDWSFRCGSALNGVSMHPPKQKCHFACK
jgi:hypothetical protein